MAVALTSGDFDSDPAHALGKLGIALDGLTSEGHLYDDEEELPSDVHRVRISRTYLWLLGYLEKDNGSGTVDAPYREAVASFQQQTGSGAGSDLTETGWRNLRELASFDTSTAVARWLHDEAGAKVLRRAVHLRLFSYGLVKRSPPHREPTGSKAKRHEKAFAAALKDFARICTCLGLSDVELTSTMNVPLLQKLFDHRGLVGGLQLRGERFAGFAQHSRHPLSEKDNRRLQLKFIGNLALVELWLLGYEVRPGSFKPEGAHGNGVSGGLHSALSQFAKDRELDVHIRRQVETSAWFFEEARKIQERPIQDTEIEEDKLDELVRNSKRMGKLRRTFESLGARILDGIGRVVSWIFGFFRRVFRALKQLLRNIARALHQGALVIYRHLKAVIEVCGEGYRYLFRSPVAGSSVESVYVRKRLDFDMDVYVHPRAAPGSVDRFFDALFLRVRAMEVGGAVVVELIGLIRSVLSALNAVLGWLGLIITLVKLANRLKRAVVLARESVRIVEELRRRVVT